MTSQIIQVFLLIPLACIAGQAHAGDARPSAMSVRALEVSYLDCERRALEGRIGTDEIRWCSEVYETLKKQVFDGDWTRLRAWSELQLSPEVRT